MSRTLFCQLVTQLPGPAAVEPEDVVVPDDALASSTYLANPATTKVQNKHDSYTLRNP